MAANMKRKKSLAEKIKDRREGGGERDESGQKYFIWPEFPRKKRREVLIQQFAVLKADYCEMRIHFIQDRDNDWHVVRCSNDRGLPRGERRKCQLCGRANRLKSAGKDMAASRASAKNTFLWNVMWKGAEPFVDEETGEKYCKVFQHGWSVYEGIGDMLDEGHVLVGKGRVWLKVYRIRKGNIKRKKDRDQISYKAAAGEKFKLPAKWKALNLHVLEDFYQVADPEDIAEWLGKSVPKRREKGKHKKKSEKELMGEDDDEDIEELDED